MIRSRLGIWWKETRWVDRIDPHVPLDRGGQPSGIEDRRSALARMDS